MNCALIKRLADQVDEAKLRSVCLILDKKVTGFALDGSSCDVNMQDMVSYGIANPISCRTINEVINAAHNKARAKSKLQ